MDSITNVTSTTTTLSQVSGSSELVDKIGDWNVILGNKINALPHTLVMLKNPSCTIGGHALKTLSGYRSVLHEVNDYLSLVDQQGLSFRYTRFEGTLRVINGLDYIPVLTWSPTIPPTSKMATIPRRSQRVKTPSLKLRENNQQPTPSQQ